MTEHVLNYDHSIVPQEYGWDCGDGSAQIVLNSRGVIVSEDTLIPQEGTTVNGTNDISCITPVLNNYLPGANYQFAYIPNDPPTQADKDQLWSHITQSIDAGYGLVLNWIAPPSNYPVGVKGSQSPSYGGGTVYHYVTAMGYDDASRAVWIADCGFRPWGYWVSLDQCASLIAPKGYTFSTAAPVAPTPPAPEPAPAPIPVAAQNVLFADVSEFQTYVDDSYPYEWISIRSNDGTYRDHKFAQNYAWCVNAVNSGRLKGFIVYFYWRPNWQDCVNTMQAMVNAAGGPHPKMVAMIDVERGGNPAGDFSDALNATDDALATWLGSGKRVIAYGNTGDLDSMWSNRREDQLIIAAYGSNPDYPGKFAHQYTDGSVGAGSLPSGCSPFGNCDMNSADGYSPDSLAVELGVANTNQGGPFMALSDQQQADLYNAIMAIAAVVSDNNTQLRGPNQQGWPQIGQNAQGQNLTLVDGIAAVRSDLKALTQKENAQ